MPPAPPPPRKVEYTRRSERPYRAEQTPRPRRLYLGKLAATTALFLCLLGASVAAYAPGPANRPTTVAPPELSAGDARAIRDPQATGDAQAIVSSPAERGRTLFLAKGCLACHALVVRGDSLFAPSGPQVGPDLTRLGAVAATRRPGTSAAAYVRESILEPQAFVVPGYGAPANSPERPAMPRLAVTAEEADALTRFLLAPR